MSIALIELDGKLATFVHVPKTGGTSIRSDCQIGKSCLFEPKPEWKQFPSFGFVRDPFDRVVSAWKDFRFLRKLTKLNFRDFVIWYNRKGIERRIADPCSIEHHVAPIYHEVHGLCYASFVGRYETLQSDYNQFRSRLGLQPKALAHERTSRKFQRSTPSRKENMDIVLTYYARDYDYLDSIGLGYEI